jgi:hypothetical protein
VTDFAGRITVALESIHLNWDDALSPLPSGTSGGKNANKKGSRPPLPAGSLSARTEVWEFLASWIRYTTAWYDTDGRITSDAADMATWLLGHANDLAADETIQDETPGLERLARELHHAANPPAPQPDKTIGPSPLSPWGRLEEATDRRLRCTDTGEIHPDWWWWATSNSHDPDATYTREELAKHLETDLANIRKLIHRGKINEPIYRAEVAYQAKEDAERRRHNIPRTRPQAQTA